MTRRFAITLACAVLVSGSVVAPAYAHVDVVGHNDPQRGLIYDGLERVTSGPCARLFCLKRSGGCTHGPDPALAGMSVAADPVPVTFPAGASPRVQCDGDGSGGARVQVLYAHASDVTDRFATFADSFRQWAADADRIVRNSATDTNGERHIRFVTDQRQQQRAALRARRRGLLGRRRRRARNRAQPRRRADVGAERHRGLALHR